jgi:TRAP transporter TAXI family solute receptor
MWLAGLFGIVVTVSREHERGRAMLKKGGRGRLVIFACLLALIGLGAIVAWFSFVHLTLRVATGPVGSDGQKFLAAFVRTVADEHPRVRFKVVPTPDLDASAKALADGQVDLAVVRSDMLTSTPGQTIIILRRDVVGLIVPPHSPIETVGHLAGKTLGVVPGPAGNDRLLDEILTHYQVPTQTLRRVVLAPNEIGPAIRQKRIAALFVVGPIGPGPLADAVTAVAKASKGVPDLLEIEAAEAIVKRFPVLEEADIPPGAFGATPPKTEDSLKTLAVTLRLVARASMWDYMAGEIARMLLTTKAKLLSTLPQVGSIEAPDPDKDSSLPVHPGAAAYFDGNQTSLLDRFQDFFYLGLFLLSIIGSGCAWIASKWRSAESSQDREQMQQRLLAIFQEVPTVGLDRLDALDQEVDEICALALKHITHETMDSEQFQVFAGAVTQVRQALDKRRALLH